MVEEKLVFYQKKAFKRKVLTICGKEECVIEITLSSSLRFEGFDFDEEINNTMNGTPQDEYDGYKCNISNDFNSDGTMKKCSNSMSEGCNEEGNGEKK